MPISNQLLATLAMDAYNQGYGPSIAHGQTHIGAATLIGAATGLPANAATTQSWIDTGFYAAAYSVGGEIVISYRGTDDALDGWNDFLTISGSPISAPPQVRLAVQFYEAVKAASPGVNIILTGHSLGGALAGIVGAIRGEDAVLFNNIAFEATAKFIRDEAAKDAGTMRADFYNGQVPPANDFSHIASFGVPGDIAGNTRGLQSTPVTAIGSQTSGQNLNAVTDVGFIPAFMTSPILGLASVGLAEINLHWQSFLVIKQFAETNGFDALWTQVYKPVVVALYSNSIAEVAIGSPDYSTMQKMLAYSTIENKTGLVFGNTAIHSLFNDVTELAKASAITSPLFGFDSQQAIANTLVEYASMLANRHVSQVDHAETIQGMLKLSTNSQMLNIDMSDDTWDILGALPTSGPPAILDEGSLISYAVNLAENNNALLPGTRELPWLQHIADAALVDQIALPAKAGTIGDLVRTTSTDTQFFDLIVGGKSSNEIIGTAGKDIIVGGNFGDKLIGDNGDDILFGGRGSDTLDGELGNGDVAVFSGNLSEYDIVKKLNPFSDPTITVSHARGTKIDGTDTLQRVEVAQFADAKIALAAPSATTSFVDGMGLYQVSTLDEVAQVYLETTLGAGVGNVNYTGSGTAAYLVSSLNIPNVVNGKGGILLSTGDMPDGINNQTAHSVANNTPGDIDLSKTALQAFANAGGTNDAAVLEFTFNNTNPNTKSISFDVVFGSDEYPEFQDSYVDVAAVYVNGVNYALFNNNPATPLSITGQNVGAGNLLNNATNKYNVEWDGLSGLLNVRANLKQGLNTIKIGVADTKDNALDSGLYISNIALQNNSVSNNGILSVVTGTPTNTKLAAQLTPEKFVTSAVGKYTVAGTTPAFNNDVFSGLKYNDIIKVLDSILTILKIKATKGSAIIDIDSDLDGKVDAHFTIEGNFDKSEFLIGHVGNDTTLSYWTEDDLHAVTGSKKNDRIVGTSGDDVLRSLGGKLDTLKGGAGDDVFVFGSEFTNGKREKDMILDYQVNDDFIRLTNGARVETVRETGTGVTLILSGDHDTIYVKGAGLTAESIRVYSDEDTFFVV
jgi:Protein of unknown function (DUF2974)/RTX calcium-binding nonapeptide repeat (4 copies)